MAETTDECATPDATIHLLEADGLQVAASMEVRASGDHDLYQACTGIAHVQPGRMTVLRGHQLDVIGPGETAVLRKFTSGRYFKTWEAHEGSFRMIGFLVQDEFLKELEGQLPERTVALHEVPALVKLGDSAALQGLWASLEGYFANGGQVDRSMLRLKTLEAILATVQAEPRLATVFREFAKPLRADLEQFMERYVTEKVTLEELARNSGRSLSTFNREFRERFQDTPHRWIKRRRLEKARDLMQRLGRKPSEVYLEVGFEDLAHFSRSFKAQFGFPPSELGAAKV